MHKIVFLSIVFLTACSSIIVHSVPTTTPLPPNTNTPAITANLSPTPSVSMIEVDGLSVPDPKISTSEIFDVNNPDSPIVQLTNAMKNAGIETTIEQVSGNIVFSRRVDKEDNPVFVGSYFLDEASSNLLGLKTGEIPLMITKEADKTGNFIWTDSVSRVLAEKNKKIIGATAYYPIYGDELGRNLTPFLAKYFNALILENHLRWNGVEENQGELDRTRMEQVKGLISFAEKNNMTLVGRSLFYYDENPQWLETTKFTKEQFLGVVNKRIIDMLTSFPEIQIWELFNELHELNLGWHPDSFQSAMQRAGLTLDDVILFAFQKANEINPNAQFIMSDSYNETIDGENYQRYRERVDLLLKNNIANVLVGFHDHFNMTSMPSLEAQEQGIKSYSVGIVVTENDINMKDVPLSDPEREIKQARGFVNTARACIENLNCKGIFFWNPGDSGSWLENPVNKNESFFSPNADGTPFNDDLSPKISFFAVEAVLLENLESNSK